VALSKRHLRRCDQGPYRGRVRFRLRTTEVEVHQATTIVAGVSSIASTETKPL
jgi:hypothetical protein